MKPMIRATIVPVAALATCLLAGRAEAAPISWGAAQNISGDADVASTGTLVGALNIGGPGVANTTVNGTTFIGQGLSGTSVTSGQFTFALPAGFQSNNGVGSPLAPFAALSLSYQSLLSSLAGNQFADPFTLTIAGLSVGHQYEFEFWSNTSDFLNTVTTATATNSTSLGSNPTDSGGGVGQFGIGTFTADVSNEVISFNSTTEPLINGLQLRDITPTTAPEPAGLALFGVGLGGLGLIRRRRGGRRGSYDGGSSSVF
jgi:hypothetical protein